MVLQRVAVCAYVHLSLGPVSINIVGVGVLQCVAVCCSVLQRVAVCCSVCVCASESGSCVYQQCACGCVAVCCSVLQRVAVCAYVHLGLGLVCLRRICV